jgi:hypothetical protein
MDRPVIPLMEAAATGRASGIPAGGSKTVESNQTEAMTMNLNSSAMDLVVQASYKLDAQSHQWGNVLAFIQSCYGCRVRDYDLSDAVASLNKLTDAEQHAIIAWVLLLEEVREGPR